MTAEQMLSAIENAYITGTALELSKYYVYGWVAIYRVRVQGHKRWRNIGGSGDTALEAIQDAQTNLFDFASSRQLMYGASEAIAAINSVTAFDPATHDGYSDPDEWVEAKKNPPEYNEYN